MRYFLVNVFLCSDCGSKLELADSKNQKPERYDGKHDNITGAHKVEVKITINPCSHCKEKSTKAEKILEQIAAYGEKVSK